MPKLPIKLQVVQGNCIEWMNTSFGRKYDLIFCDPPFNIGQAYDEHNDSMQSEDYGEFTRAWLSRATGRLADGGVLAVHGSIKVNDLVRREAENLPLKELSRLIWHYRFGQHTESNWIPSYAVCSVFCTGSKPNTWNSSEVLVDSDRASKYDDSRTKTKSEGVPGKRVPFDVWGIPSDGPYWGRVQGNNKERVKGHPNQLPEVYLERMIRAYTNPGDWVLDPFGGTGTTIVVCKALGRNCTTIEKSRRYCKDIAERLYVRGSVRVTHSIL